MIAIKQGHYRSRLPTMIKTPDRISQRPPRGGLSVFKIIGISVRSMLPVGPMQRRMSGYWVRLT
jgi:hypothetical protein